MKDVEEVLQGILARAPDYQGQGVEPPWVREERLERERLARLARADRIDAIGLPERTLALFQGRAGPVRDTPARAAIAAPGWTLLVLSGTVGCGKSIAAAEWLYTGEQGRWLTSARLSRFAKYDSKAMDALLGTPRLVLDDLGAEYLDAAGALMSTLDELVNERYAHDRPLVITTNLAADDFKARYGARIADRIREVGQFTVVDGPSLRTKRQP